MNTITPIITLCIFWDQHHFWRKKIRKTQKLLKVTLSQELRIAYKKSFVQKMSTRSIPIYPVNLATFEENWIFGHPERPFWAPMAPKRDVMCYEILYPSFFLAHCASLISRWPLLSGRWVCISVVGTVPVNNRLQYLLRINWEQKIYVQYIMHQLISIVSYHRNLVSLPA